MPIRSLGYIHWRTPELDAWRSFATDVLGMMLVDGPDPDALYFRIDDRPYRLMISRAAEKSIGALGYEVADDIELADMARRVEDAGIKIVHGSEAESEHRLVNGYASFEDPSGIPVEMFYGPILDHVPVHTPLVSSFVTGAMGMGHLVIGTPEHAATIDMYRNVLGFRLRNNMRLGPAGSDHRIPLSFLGCNARHHTFGVVGIPFPGNLTHFMLEAASIDDVGYALDRCEDAGVTLSMRLGKHTNDHMISFYCVAPDGVMVEFGWGGLEVDNELETTYEITKTSFWGHRPQAAPPRPTKSAGEQTTAEQTTAEQTTARS
jgi:3,4-dihydroxy-9,10-secoandrosta-1,3,5(10)-triene-9,17-dione 4,5-dioxygenase